MSVSAIIVTRGDVDLRPILESLPDEWEKLVWENGERCLRLEAGPFDTRDEDWRYWRGGLNDVSFDAPDLSVYGRYAAIQYASHDLIYVQDDDCIVSDPQAIVDAHELENVRLMRERVDRALAAGSDILDIRREDYLVANMPPEFRHDGYTDSCLVGFGACFHRDLPQKAFDRFLKFPTWSTGLVMEGYKAAEMEERWRRTCDVVFTALTPRVLVDVPVEVLPHAHDSNRMWKQPDHYGERTRVLEMARKVRDA